MIKRDRYLHMLIRGKENGKVKVITGLRRCGKTVLLHEIYHQYLISVGVPASHIIELLLDEDRNAQYRNPLELGVYIRNQLADPDHMYYVFLDGIQRIATIPNPYRSNSGETIGMIDVLQSLAEIENVDLYVTGGAGLFSSPNVPAEFRARVDEIRVYPLSYSEFCGDFQGDRQQALEEYLTFGGMPQVLAQQTPADKAGCLRGLLDGCCLDDIASRCQSFRGKNVLEDILHILASSAGQLSSPSKIAGIYASEKETDLDEAAVDGYLGCFLDAFLLNRMQRYDVKGVKYIGSPVKYYFSDTGLFHACTGFGQREDSRAMEIAILSELILRGFEADVGIVGCNYRDETGKSRRVQLEVDFLASRGSRRYYIQSAESLADEAVRAKKINPLLRIGDSFRKLVIVRDAIAPQHDENGILYLGLEQFLLQESAVNI